MTWLFIMHVGIILDAEQGDNLEVIVDLVVVEQDVQEDLIITKRDD